MISVIGVIDVIGVIQFWMCPPFLLLIFWLPYFSSCKQMWLMWLVWLVWLMWLAWLRFVRAPPFFFFNRNFKEKNFIHNHVIDVIDVIDMIGVIEFLMYLTKW
jgi:hypothetical protein